MGNEPGKQHHQPQQQQHQQQQHQQQQHKDEPYRFVANKDKYESIEMVQDGLAKAGLESSNLIVGVDFTISNTDAGKRTFFGLSLHHLSADMPNPYQQVISTLGRTLERFDDDKLIPAYGFGDQTTKDKAVFCFKPNNEVCRGFEELLQRYTEIVPAVKLGGPTSFAPMIRQAIDIVKQQHAYHILIIVADGQVTCDSDFCHATSETINAIVEASNYPLSIIVVGVGDGPWEQMDEFDNQLPQRKFDNFRFVDYFKVVNEANGTQEMKDVSFAVAALQEIPDQYIAIRKLHLL
eukprot:TRINITY_DN1910_c0_g1_i1.p1 TRINITY_DN1910_c0_g1~~TRINITY_DN1910_c0_g1_i1.p1  ORF type:complete len:293 (-),score=78.91 TRINITY_DN1910_c0_g1_i1:69-947(-)